MKSSLSLAMIASLCLFGCGKECKEKKSKQQKNDVVAEVTKQTSDTIPLFNIDDAFPESQEYAYGDNDGTAPVDYAYDDSNDLIAWNDEQLLQETAEAEFKTVLFDFNAKAPRADQKSLLQDDVKLAKAAIEEGKRLRIHGHTDQMGAAGHNLALSEKRAQSVKNALVEAGVPSEKVEVVGFGYEVPLVWSDAQTREEKINDLALNRRAEIFAYSESEE